MKHFRCCLLFKILSDATRKLQMIRPAQRLFDRYGNEIFRSEDIQRDMDYYVSEGEDFISPLEAIKCMSIAIISSYYIKDHDYHFLLSSEK